MMPAPTSSQRDPLDLINLKKFFLYHTSRVLNHGEFKNLEEFLETMSQPSLTSDESLQRLLEQEYAAFIDKENLVINNGAQSLSKWHGRASSRLGLLLHNRTRGHPNDSQSRIPSLDAQNSVSENIDGLFWEEGSLTIKAIEAKGIDRTLVFGFDWHWRALPWSAKLCQAKKEFGLAALDLHDAFSRHIGDIATPIADSRWLLSSIEYSAPSSRKSKRISLPFNVTKKKNKFQFDLIFDLVFETTQLKRLVVYTPHPSTI